MVMFAALSNTLLLTSMTVHDAIEHLLNYSTVLISILSNTFSRIDAVSYTFLHREKLS
jgi:hypothetical protein